MTATTEVHHSHRDVSGGWLRPAVFGVMDGLVSNTALIAGIAGAGASTATVAATGLAGLVAGACSMALGEYVSVTSQNELAHAEIEVERRELTRAPAAEQAELAGMYRRRGLDPELAAEVARQLSRNPEVALDIHTREELGIDPDGMPSPWVACGSSFAAFAVGALLPLLPYLLGFGSLGLALVLGATGLVVSGALTARFTVRAWWYSAGRQLLLGTAAAGVTYVIGLAVGSGLG